MYEIFGHTADAGIRASATTLAELLEEAAQGFVSLLVGNPDTLRKLEEFEITVSGQDPAYLLFDWLNELLYLFETEHFLPAEYELSLDGDDLRARLRGERVDPDRHQLGQEIKAITYHQLEVTQTDEGWQASVIVDI